MESSSFDAAIRSLSRGRTRTRRTAAVALAGGALAALGVALPGGPGSGVANAKSKQPTAWVKLCYNGSEVRKRKEDKKKWLRRGATPGACEPAPAPPCTPDCDGTCGVDDGCGTPCACAAGVECIENTCRKPGG